MSNPTTHIEQFNASLGAFTGVGPIRYDDGLWIEQAGLNYVLDPLFHNNMASTFWANNGKDAGIDATLSRYLQPPAVGRWAIASVSSIGMGGHMFLGGITANGTFAPGDPVTASAKVMSSGFNGRHAIAIRPMSSTGTLLGVFTKSGEVPCDGSEHSISVTIPSLPADTAKITVYVATYCSDLTPANETSDCLICNVEKSTYATSFIPGRVGTGEALETGYAFTGTAHNSPSTRAASSASLDPAGVLSSGTGALAFRVTPTIETGLEELWGECGTKGSGTDHVQWGRDASTHPFVEWSSNDATHQRLTATETLAAGTKFLFYTDWDGTAIRLSIDNGTLHTDTRDAVSDSWGAGDLVLKAE